MKKPLIITTIIVFALLVYFVNAYTYPMIDFHQFYGSVSGVSDGTNITAKLGNDTFKTTVSDHKYGYSPKFFVQGNESGGTVKFYIHGNQVKTHTFQKGSITKLDLTYTGVEEEEEEPARRPSDGRRDAADWYWRTTTRPDVRNVTNVTVAPPVECFDDWLCHEWGPCEPPGIQIRACYLNDYPNCTQALPKPPEQQSCELPPPPPPPPASCFDGIQNQDETFADCGGIICKKCDPYLSCFLDRDCVTGYCDPMTKTCGWPPVVEVPAPPPKPSYWWIWLILGVFLLAGAGLGFFIYHRYKMPEMPKEAMPAKEEIPARLKELKSYADTFVKKGVPKARIEAKLKEAGWKPDDIRKVLK